MRATSALPFVPLQRPLWPKGVAHQAEVVHTFNPSTWQSEAGRSQGAEGQPGLQGELLYSQDYYTKKHCLEKQNKQKNPNKQTNKKTTKKEK